MYLHRFDEILSSLKNIGPVILYCLLVCYFTEMISGSFGNRPVNKSIHYVMAILIGLLRCHTLAISIRSYRDYINLQAEGG